MRMRTYKDTKSTGRIFVSYSSCAERDRIERAITKLMEDG